MVGVVRTGETEGLIGSVLRYDGQIEGELRCLQK